MIIVDSDLVDQGQRIATVQVVQVCCLSLKVQLDVVGQTVKIDDVTKTQEVKELAFCLDLSIKGSRRNIAFEVYGFDHCVMDIRHIDIVKLSNEIQRQRNGIGLLSQVFDSGKRNGTICKE